MMRIEEFLPLEYQPAKALGTMFFILTGEAKPLLFLLRTSKDTQGS